MIFKKLSSNWAMGICEVAGETDSYKIALTGYVFELMLSFWLSFGVLFIAAWILGILKTALIVGFTGAVLKSITGGPHMSTPLGCALIGAVSIIAISYLAILLPIATIPSAVVIAILAVINVIVWSKAPMEVKGKPLTPVQKKVLATLSRIIVFLISLCCVLWSKTWGINGIFYGMLAQVLYLLDFLKEGMNKIDQLYRKIEKKAVF